MNGENSAIKEADKENKKEECILASEESARSKVMTEEIKVLESMENMDKHDIQGRKQCSVEEVNRPNSSTSEI